MRELHTAEEIRDEVDRLVNAGRKVAIEVPLPLRLVEPDWIEAPDCNWQMPAFSNTRGNEDAIRAAVLAVRAKWDLI